MSEDRFFRFLQKLGFNTTRMRWRWMQRKNRIERTREGFKVAKDHATYQHKICDECGALMDGSEQVCPRCGSKAPKWSGQVAKRVFGLVLPSWGPFALLLIVANVMMLGVGLVGYGPSFLTSPPTVALMRLGALIPDWFYDGEYWRLITYGYLHIGILHIAFNLIALIQVGPFLEKEIGSARFFSVYTLTLIGGGVADLLFRKGVFLVAGASGALFGLIGFGISYNHFLGGPTAYARRNFFMHWALYGFLFGIFARADNIAHAGGLVVGVVLGFLIEKEGMRRKSFNTVWQVIAGLCVLVTIASLIGMALGYSLPPWPFSQN